MGTTIRGTGLVARTNLDLVVFAGPPGWIAGAGVSWKSLYFGCGVSELVVFGRDQCSRPRLCGRQSVPVMIALHVFPTTVGSHPSTVSPPGTTAIAGAVEPFPGNVAKDGFREYLDDPMRLPIVLRPAPQKTSPGFAHTEILKASEATGVFPNWTGGGRTRASVSRTGSAGCSRRWRRRGGF